MFWKRKASNADEAATCARSLYQSLVEGLKVEGRVRAEDLIASAASIVGETCIAAAGDFNPRQHTFVPGSRVFSDKVNQIFCGDIPGATVESVPADSIVGRLRDAVVAGGYATSEFPPLKTLFEHYAANIGKQSDWGKVPLAVPEQNYPFVLPLRVAYDTRPIVDRIFAPLSSPNERLKSTVLTLAAVLVAVGQVIDHKLALLLALQTVNGMAKTAPMTDEAMRSLKEEEQPKAPPNHGLNPTVAPRRRGSTSG